MPKNKDAYDYVVKQGLIAIHDLEGVEAIYPGSFDESAALHTPKFHFAPNATAAREHLGALIAADLWEKRGGAKVDENIDARVQAAKAAAEDFLKTTAEKRSATLPPRPAPTGEGSST